ncbi:MAG: hypothetical protein EOO37_02655 [Cytophagaceae bacterium]|nr:MAG: hypothetical protein EOO37_02655 [Cytophagaceae bacterium]
MALKYGFLLICVLVLAASCESPDDKSPSETIEQSQVSLLSEQTHLDAEDEKILAKVKAKIKRDYPNDYAIQLALYNQESEDYEYMKSANEADIKKKVQRDYPLDFSIQKTLYNQEIDAKEQMK